MTLICVQCAAVPVRRMMLRELCRCAAQLSARPLPGNMTGTHESRERAGEEHVQTCQRCPSTRYGREPDRDTEGQPGFRRGRWLQARRARSSSCCSPSAHGAPGTRCRRGHATPAFPPVRAILHTDFPDVLRRAPARNGLPSRRQGRLIALGPAHRLSSGFPRAILPACRFPPSSLPFESHGRSELPVSSALAGLGVTYSLPHQPALSAEPPPSKKNQRRRATAGARLTDFLALGTCLWGVLGAARSGSMSVGQGALPAAAGVGGGGQRRVLRSRDHGRALGARPCLPGWEPVFCPRSLESPQSISARSPAEMKLLISTEQHLSERPSPPGWHSRSWAQGLPARVRTVAT